MFQIPFGAEGTSHRSILTFQSAHRMLPDPLEDILNFFMTIGSPALAAYSLQITHLNARWLSKALLDSKYHNSNAIATVISSFQHIPIQLSPNPVLLPSLIVLPQNNGYWDLLLKGVEKTRRWSIPLVMNFVWVVFAILLTIIDSFNLSRSSDAGYGIVATWTYLLAIIMGWLHVGSQPEPNHLRDCLDAANKIAWVASERKNRPDLAVDLAGQLTRAIGFTKGDVDAARGDELRVSPVFNFSRTFTWSQKAQHILTLVRNAADKAERRIPVDNYGSGRGAVWVVGENGSVANENRLGTDEQVINYCREDATAFEKVFGAPGPIVPSSPVSSRTPSTLVALLPFYDPRTTRRFSRWAPGVWTRVTLAALLALGLQWGTVTAAVTIHYWSVPVGLGCRSLSFLVYGVVATLAFFLCLTSSILAHISRPQGGKMDVFSWSQTCLDGGAVFCGYSGKILAVGAGIGILVVCFVQSAGAFNNCYCSSVTFDRGFHDVVLVYTDNVASPVLVHIWIGGLVLAFSAAVFFGISIYLGNPPRR